MPAANMPVIPRYFNPQARENVDRQRRALAKVTVGYRPATISFIRQVNAAHIDGLTEAQRLHIIRLCWRYRAQIPRALRPAGDVVESRDMALNVAEFEALAFGMFERHGRVIPIVSGSPPDPRQGRLPL